MRGTRSTPTVHPVFSSCRPRLQLTFVCSGGAGSMRTNIRFQFGCTPSRDVEYHRDSLEKAKDSWGTRMQRRVRAERRSRGRLGRGRKESEMLPLQATSTASIVSGPSVHSTSTSTAERRRLCCAAHSTAIAIPVVEPFLSCVCVSYCRSREREIFREFSQCVVDPLPQPQHPDQ